MKLTKPKNCFQAQHYDASSCSFFVFPAIIILLSILYSIPRRSKAFLTYHYHSANLHSILITMRKWEPLNNISINLTSGFLSKHLWRSRSGEIFHENTISTVRHRKQNLVWDGWHARKLGDDLSDYQHGKTDFYYYLRFINLDCTHNANLHHYTNSSHENQERAQKVSFYHVKQHQSHA